MKGQNVYADRKRDREKNEGGVEKKDREKKKDRQNFWGQMQQMENRPSALFSASNSVRSFADPDSFQRLSDDVHALSGQHHHCAEI